MQFINYAIEFVAFAFVAHTALHLTSGLVSLWNSGESAPLVEKLGCEWDEERLTELYVEQSQDAQAEDWLVDAQQAPVLHPPMSWSDAVVLFSRPVKSATEPVKVADLLKQRSIRQLKAIASTVRLPRYGSLAKPQLIERLLSEVDVARLQEVIAG